jgi:opine dehydrogenase
MKITVLGAGSGGLAIAYEWASAGHDVGIYSREEHARNIGPVRQHGGITSQGVMAGFGAIETATTDVGEAMKDTDVVFVVGPAYATANLGTDVGPYLHEGMTVVVCPGSCVGSLAFKRAAGLDLRDETVVVGETSTLPYAVRTIGDAKIQVFHRFDSGFFAAAAPRSATTRLLHALRTVWPHTEEAATIFQTTLRTMDNMGLSILGRDELLRY